METQTETKTEQQAVNNVVAIARTETSTTQVWEAPRWDEKRVDLLRRTICPPQTTELEFQFFLSWCQRTGLDPFIKQAYFIERSAEVNGRWVKKMEPMASEAGLAARADAQPDFRGIEAAAVYEGDVFRVVRTPDGSTSVHHEWSPADRAKAGNKLLGAWAHAKRAGRTVQVTYLPLASRMQTTREGKPTKFWATMPEGQIVKCSRAEQYRLAYPNLFGGVYIPEEMPDEETHVEGQVISSTPNAPPAAPSTSATKALGEKLAAKVGKPAPTPPGAKPAAAEAPKAEVSKQEVQKSEAPPTAAAAVVQFFAAHKGKPISGLAADELSECIEFCEGKLVAGAEKLKANPNDAKIKAAFAAVEAEHKALLAERQARIELVAADEPAADEAPSSEEVTALL